MTYDVANRLIKAENNGATRRGEYDYDPRNKRIWEKRTLSGSVTGEWVYFFGITGQRRGREQAFLTQILSGMHADSRR